MSVNFDVFYEQFSRKHFNKGYMDMKQDEVVKIFRSALISAISRFRTCYDDKTVDEVNDQIVEDLTMQEIEITVEFMVLIWFETMIQDVESYKHIITTSDYKVVTQNNMLSQKEDSKENKKKYIDKLVAEYGSKKAIEAIKNSNIRRKKSWWLS